MSWWSFVAGVMVGFELVVLVHCGTPISGRLFSYRRHFWWTHVEFWAPWWEWLADSRRRRRAGEDR